MSVSTSKVSDSPTSKPGQVKKRRLLPSPSPLQLQKKRKFSSSNSTSHVLSTEDQLRLKSVAQRLQKEAQRLPVNEAKDELVREVMEHDTVVVMAETGSGKSTQIPHLLYTHPTSLAQYPIPPNICITQPRRLPCVSLSTRVAEEMGSILGDKVGYAVRFESKEKAFRVMKDRGKQKGDIHEGEMSGGTGVRFCTEGVLLRELSNYNSSSEKKKKKEDLSLESTPNTPLTASTSTSTITFSSSSSNVASAPTSSTETPRTEARESSRLLLRYDIIIIDEAHERTLNTDFLLGSLKSVQAERARLCKEGKKGELRDGWKIRKLKLVVMSATIDAEKFSAFFNKAPILFIKGRTFPVDIYHTTSDPGEDKVEAALKQCVKIHMDMPKGDVLVFMPGQEEIDGLVKSLEQINADLPEVFDQILAAPLYRNLSDIKQRQVFAPTPSGKRKIVVSTNIAETGLTIPNIVYVVDSGLQKEKNVVPLSTTGGTVSALQSRACSQAAAKQRSGRAGRTAAGICYRLYTKLDYETRLQATIPEILRADLASAFLQLLAWGQNPAEFDYLDAPERASLIQALQMLMQLEAIQPGKNLPVSSIGRKMLHYPVNPLLSKVLISSFEFGCTKEMIEIIALREAGNPILESYTSREAADRTRKVFVHRDGDHLTGMNIFRGFLETLDRARRESAANPSNPSEKAVRKAVLDWCNLHSLSFRVLHEAKQLRDQLIQLVKNAGENPEITAGEDSSRVLHCLSRGLFMNAARLQPDGKSYQPIFNRIKDDGGLKIHPSSVLAMKKIPTIVFDEIALTTSYYAHNVSAIEESWLGEIPGLSDDSIENVRGQLQ